MIEVEFLRQVLKDLRSIDNRGVNYKQKVILGMVMSNLQSKIMKSQIEEAK